MPHQRDNNTAEGPKLWPGMRVEVRNRFDGSWAKAFEVVDVAQPAEPSGGDLNLRVRRLSDGVILPEAFPSTEVRLDRGR